jgi:hypothetical protein
VVAIVIGATKFLHGAWAVMLFVPIGVWLLVRLNRTYDREDEQLEGGLEAFEDDRSRLPLVVVLVEDLDRKTLHALRHARTIRARATHALHLERTEGERDTLPERWAAARIDVPLRMLRHEGEAASSIAGYVAAFADEGEVTVVIPSPATTSRIERLRRGRAGSQITRALAPYPSVRVTLVRDHAGPAHAATTAADGSRGLRLVPPEDHRVVVLVDRLDRATLGAVRSALALGARDVRAVHAGVDPGAQDELIERWMDLRLPIELDLVECWDRDVARSLEHQVVELLGPRTEVTVVLPRRDFESARQRLLHDRTSRRIARVLGRYEHVDLAVVPYHVSTGPTRRGAAVFEPAAR